MFLSHCSHKLSFILGGENIFVMECIIINFFLPLWSELRALTLAGINWRAAIDSSKICHETDSSLVHTDLNIMIVMVPRPETYPLTQPIL